MALIALLNSFYSIKFLCARGEKWMCIRHTRAHMFWLFPCWENARARTHQLLILSLLLFLRKRRKHEKNFLHFARLPPKTWNTHFLRCSRVFFHFLSWRFVICSWSSARARAQIRPEKRSLALTRDCVYGKIMRCDNESLLAASQHAVVNLA